jgi:hypothetical protein
MAITSSIGPGSDAEAMPAPSNAPQKSEDQGRQFLIGLAVALVVGLAPLLLLGTLAWWVLRRWLGRLEATMLLVTSLVGLFLLGPDGAPAYLDWASGPLGGTRDYADVPYLAFLLGAMGVAAVQLLLTGTAIAAKLPHPWKKKVNPLENISVLPDEETRRGIAIVQPEGGVVVDVSQNSLLSNTAPGSRDVPLGTDERGTPVGLTEAEFGHGVVFGSTGSGKTEAIKTLAGALLDLGWSGLILDLKEDGQRGGLRDWCEEYAMAHALPHQELRLSNPESRTWFNPFRGMGPDEARDTIVTLTPGDDNFWANISTKMVGQALTLLYDAHRVDPTKFPYPTPLMLGNLFNAGANLKQYTQEMRAACLAALPERDKEDYFSMSSPTQDEAKNAPGFGAKLLTIYQTEAGRAVLRPSEEKQELDVTRGGLTYIGLDRGGKQDLTRMVSSSVLQRMSVWAAQRTNGRVAIDGPRFLIIDEAAAVNRQILANLLQLARSAKIYIICCTQSPLDWEVDQSAGKGQGVAGFNSLAQNFNYSLIMKQQDPRSAEVCAEYLGRRQVWRTSSRITEDGLVDASARQDLDYEVPPEQLRTLQPGDAVIRVASPRNRLFYVKVTRRDPRKSLTPRSTKR